MKINCPNCNAHISADNINIQTMTAVCAACDTVFKFKPPQDKSKRPRKVKQPEKLLLREVDDQLHAQFHTNWRLDQNETFVASSVLSITFLSVSLLMFFISLFDSTETSPILPLMGALFFFVSMFALYRIALLTYNKTHIDMQNDVVTVSRHPLRSPFDPTRTISMANVERIRCEETKKSKKEEYDTPRYRVWAETADGQQKLIINDVTEEYAYFITQVLDEHLVTYTLNDDNFDDGDYELLTDDDVFLHSSENQRSQQS